MQNGSLKISQGKSFFLLLLLFLNIVFCVCLILQGQYLNFALIIEVGLLLCWLTISNGQWYTFNMWVQECTQA